MADQGFVYIMINPSINGLVKIGKTTRNPEERVKELSSATGVPEPFKLIFYDFFENCTKAEIYIHSILQNRGLRPSKNREFFDISTHDAISLILEAKNSQKHSSIPIVQTDTPPTNKSNKVLWDETLKDANSYRFGLNNQLENHIKAEKLYGICSKMGSAEACFQLGVLYHHGGFKVQQDIEKALDAYEKSTLLGYKDAYAQMANIFLHEYNNSDNAYKCWEKFFEDTEGLKESTYVDSWHTFIDNNPTYPMPNNQHLLTDIYYDSPNDRKMKEIEEKIGLDHEDEGRLPKLQQCIKEALKTSSSESYLIAGEWCYEAHASFSSGEDISLLQDAKNYFMKSATLGNPIGYAKVAKMMYIHGEDDLIHRCWVNYINLSPIDVNNFIISCQGFYATNFIEKKLPPHLYRKLRYFWLTSGFEEDDF